MIGRAAMRVAVALVLASGLSACAIPPAFTIAKVATDGALLAATGKMSTDHGLSAVTGEDCATLRVFEGNQVCRPEVVKAAVAQPAEVVEGRKALGRMKPPQSPTLRIAQADEALAQAFLPYAAGGRAVIAGEPVASPVQVAALPRPVAPGAVMIAVRDVKQGLRVAQAKAGMKIAAAARKRVQIARDVPIDRAVTKVAVRKLAMEKSGKKISLLAMPEQLALAQLD